MIIYVVTQNTDLTEGRGYQHPVGYYLDKSVAEYALSQTSGVMGSRSGVELTTIEVNDSKNLKEYKEWGKEQVKRRALLKLTSDERAALGL